LRYWYHTSNWDLIIVVIATCAVISVRLLTQASCQCAKATFDFIGLAIALFGRAFTATISNFDVLLSYGTLVGDDDATSNGGALILIVPVESLPLATLLGLVISAMIPTQKTKKTAFGVASD
jgi:hypothetical protein